MKPDRCFAWKRVPRLSRYSRSIAKTVPPEILDRIGFPESFECWNRDEFEQMLELYAEDAVMDVSAVFTDTTPAHGHEDMLRYWRELRETWQGARLDPMEVLDVGNEQYVVDLRLTGKGKSSGAEVEQRAAFLYTMRDNKAIRAELHPDLPAAIAAAESGGTTPV